MPWLEGRGLFGDCGRCHWRRFSIGSPPPPLVVDDVTIECDWTTAIGRGRRVQRPPTHRTPPLNFSPSFCWGSPSFFFSGRLTGFYLILIDLTAFSLGFYRGLSVFIGFHLIWSSFTGFDRIYLVLSSFTGFYRVLPNFTRCYRVLLGFTEFYWVFPSFTWFYRVLPFYLILLGFSGFYQVLLGFTGF